MADVDSGLERSVRRSGYVGGLLGHPECCLEAVQEASPGESSDDSPNGALGGLLRKPIISI
jgi:hypothetical protein